MRWDAAVFAFLQIHGDVGSTGIDFPDATSRAVADCQPWFYLRLTAYSFFWLSEGAYGYSRDLVPKHQFSLTPLWILTLEPERRKNRRPSPEMNLAMKRALHRRSSCLLLQMFGVETNSFLPNQQSDGRDLARQGEARHRRFHPAGH